MFRRIFIGCADPAKERIFRKMLRKREAVGEEAIFDDFTDCKELWKKVKKKPPELLVIELDLPRSAEDARRPDGCGGLEFVESLLAQDQIIPTILLSYAEPSTQLEVRIAKLLHCRRIDLLRTPPEDVSQVVEAALEGLLRTKSAKLGAPSGGLSAAGSSEPLGWIEIDLRNEREPFAHCYLPDQLADRHWIIREKEALSIESVDFDDLVDRSQRLVKRLNRMDYDDWLGDFKSIGMGIYRLVFHSNMSEKLNVLVRSCNNRYENVRVRFSVQPSRCGGLFEAVVPHPRDELIMIRAPIARRVRLETETDDLLPADIGLAGDNAVNVLIIDAAATQSLPVARGHHRKLDLWLDAEERRTGRSPVFNTLAFGQAELALFQELEAAVASGRQWMIDEDARITAEVEAAIGTVRPIQPRDGETAAVFRERIKTVLERGPDGGSRFHVVHFIGHSLCADPSDPEQASFLILPGATGNEAVPATEVFRWLRDAKTRFVYLSSCESASADVTVAASRSGLPAALGFRWRLPDKSAPAFAREFYKSLFCDCQCIDEAVRDARSAVYNGGDRSHDPTWAAAVLICQSRGWHRGYGDTICRREVAP